MPMSPRVTDEFRAILQTRFNRRALLQVWALQRASRPVMGSSEVSSIPEPCYSSSALCNFVRPVEPGDDGRGALNAQRCSSATFFMFFVQGLFSENAHNGRRTF
jgi:hypothetical protein